MNAMECESTCTLILQDDTLFVSHLQDPSFIHTVKVDYHTYTVSENLTVTLRSTSQNGKQYKISNSPQFVLLYVDGVLYPVYRGCAYEIPADTIDVTPWYRQYKTSVRRLCTYIQKDGYTIRVSYAREDTLATNNTRYMLQCEVEYPASDALTYHKVRGIEYVMLTACAPYFAQAGGFTFDTLTSEKLYSTPATKLIPWQFTGDESRADFSYWAYKYDGKKAKLFFNGDNAAQCVLWEDVKPITVLNVDQTSTEFILQHATCLRNIVLQIELLDGGHAKLVQCGPVSYGGIYYYTEPVDNVAILQYVYEQLRQHRCSLIVSDIVIDMQRFFPISEFPNDDQHMVIPNNCDGLVFVSGASYYKYKRPTVDARYVGGTTFEIGDDIISRHTIPPYMLCSDGSIGHICRMSAIYELGPCNEILRLRTDRETPSTTAEYEYFKQAIANYQKTM